jgi:membrane associated rhomboid family serine protease|tara:strand:- start:1127 stop:1939 length:813 start_codon:yes stop_codon:yes gene_type:complete
MNNHIINIEDEYLLENIFNTSKPHLSKVIPLIIVFCYFFGIIFINDNLDQISPSVDNLYFGLISKYPNCDDNRYQIWRFVSSSLVHFNFSHLFGNLLILFPLLYYFEIFYKSLNMILILIIISFSSNFAFYFSFPYSYIIGCSHLVFGLFGFLLADYFLNKKYKDNIYLLQIMFSLLALILDLIFYFFKKGKNTGYIVHWAGYISGFLSSLLLLPDIKKKKYILKKRYFGLSIIVSIFLIAIYRLVSVWPPIVNDNCCYLLLTNQNTINC